MELPVHTLARLLTALEDLTSQETLLLRSGDYAGMLRIQGRVAPLVEAVADLAAVAGDSSRVRVAVVIGQRMRSVDRLADRLTHASAELNQVRTHQLRLAQIRPVYGGAESAGPRLSALG